MPCRWHEPLYIKNNCHRFAVLTILRQWQKQFVLNLTDSKIIFRSVPTFRYRKPLYCTKNVAVLQISRPRFKTFRRSGWKRCKIGIVLEVDHVSCQLVNILTVYTLQTMSLYFPIYTTKAKNLIQRRTDIQQNRQCGRTLSQAVLICRYHQLL